MFNSQDMAGIGGGVLMLWRRAILGAVALILAILVAQIGRVSTSSEDQAEAPARSGNRVDSGTTPQTEGSDEPPTDEQMIEIPLDNIWGHNRSLRGLEPELFIKRNTPEKRAEYSTPEKLQEIRDKAESSLAYQIERAMNDDVLDTDPDFKKRRPAPGFAVVGRGREALAGIHEVVVGGKEPQRKFSSNDEISLVLFTLTTHVFPYLIHAERFGTTISLHYVLPSRGRLGGYPRLYIIPVGKLPPGEYEVKLIRALQEEAKYNKQGFPSFEEGVEQSFVCRPFRFDVLEYNSKGKGAE